MTKSEVYRALREAARKSDLVVLPARPIRHWIGDPLRPVNSELQMALERNGNVCSDWGRVRVAAGFDPSRVHNCVFEGDVVIGNFDATAELFPGVVLPSGLSNSRIANCVIGDNALVCETRLLANFLVGRGAVLFANGTLSATPPCRFGVGRALSLVVETGGREVGIYAEITVDVAARVATSRGDLFFLEGYQRLLDVYVGKVRGERGFIGDTAVVRNCQRIQDGFIGPHAVIDGVALFENSCVLSNEEEQTRVEGGAWVKDSIIQWGCHVNSMAVVQDAVLCEHSGARSHAKVMTSIIGPNSAIEEGEVIASLMGPFVGFHHQALLIAAYWPEGKGNVAYGTNIGSNHTSRLPDQEIRPGEGNFFGLGTKIKFPSDFSRAPYSIIAMGATTLPQKIVFPFSLINTPATAIEGVSPAYNEIIPGWVLANNMYMVKRNEGKYLKRNKARRLKFEAEALRRETVDMMLSARDTLRKISGKNVYTDADILGLGKNYLLEDNRKRALDTYTFYIRYYTLKGLWRRVNELREQGIAVSSDLLKTKSSNKRWEHQRRILKKELPQNDLRENLELLIAMEKRVAHDTLESKRKDELRGVKIIDDYAEAHPPSEEDPFVKETFRGAEELPKRIREILRSVRS